MKRLMMGALLCISAVLKVTAQVEIVPGVSWELAQFRAKNVKDVMYFLDFHIPDKMEERVSGTANIYFQYDGGESLQLDFQGVVEETIQVNGKEVKACCQQEHIVVAKEDLQPGQNNISVRFTSEDKALNRSADYLYTLFVPDHARSVFPCFDQPDLKGRYKLTLQLPDGWRTISNGRAEEPTRTIQGCGTVFHQPNIYVFDVTDPLPTYLFSFSAGKFEEQTATRDGRELTALYRETDPAKVAQLPTIFDEIALSIRWMEQYTGIQYPFQKYGFVILPGYQFGGMEHPGCIQFKDNTLFLGPSPTPDEEMNRLHLLAHETAHIWFGDLVTMRWFNDVWTKEVFANFMADKIAREQYPDINHDLSFLRTHYIPAFTTDRTLGTHPIQQQLANLNQAGLLYGNIIYHKAPIMMRKLELQMGSEAFQRGLQKYLKQFSFGNATWDDLIQILHQEAPAAHILDFDRQWVKQKGIPTKMLDPNAAELPDLDGMDYVRYELADSTAAEKYIERLTELPTKQGQLAAVMTLYDNMLMQRMPAVMFALTVVMMTQTEVNEQQLSSLGSYIIRTLPLLTDEERTYVEKKLWETAQDHPVKSFRQQILRSLSRVAQSAKVVNSLYAIWQEGNHPLLNERDYMNMAYHLAVMRPQDWQQIIGTQRGRLTHDDVKREFDFVSRGCTPDESEQQRLFESLLKAENRTIEPYAAALLTLLNDPTREPFSNRYITPALEALEEIQRTGDIFFPLNWCQSLLDGHHSREAAERVREFLDSHPDYPEALRNKLLQAAYVLMSRI